MASDIDNAIFEAWDRAFPLLKADPVELRRRLARRRLPLLTRPPRAYCIAVRASDNRVNARNFPCCSEKFAMHDGERFILPRAHEVTLTKRGLVKVTASVDLRLWRAHYLTEAAEKLGVSPDSLMYQRKKGILKVDFVPHLGGRKSKSVPLIMRDGLADPCGRNGHTPAAPEWGHVWSWIAETLPDDFEQTLERVPDTRLFGGKQCFRGFRWICPKCGEKVSSIFLPKRTIMTVATFLSHEEELITSGDDEVRPFDQTFACTKCHRIRYWTSLDHSAWNQLVAVLSGGLLYGVEVKKPEWFTPRRRRAYARHKSNMVRGKEVERLLIEGKRYHEVAEAMGIALSTVQGHVRRLYKKRGVHSRKALLASSKA